MAIKEFNVDLDVKGRVLASTVPNSTGSIVTWNTTTNVFGLRTNSQIISDLGLNTVVSNSHTHPNKSTLDGIQASDISNWDEAYSKTHVHANKSTLDSILQVDLDNWNEAHNKSHTHANKTILDGISSSDIEDWEEAYDKKVNAISFTGDTNKTLTVTREDGSILTASFLDNNDPQFPDDVLNTLTFNDNNDGVLRAITSEGSIIDVSLDGRYSLLGHKHVWEDITDRPTSLSDFTNDLGNYGNWITKAQGDTYYSAIGHTHTFASLTSKPTTIAGYGITDFNSLGDARWALRSRTITGTGSLTGGGNLTANRTLDLTSTAKSDIAKGVTAHGWGDFREFGLGRNTSTYNILPNETRTSRFFRSTGGPNAGSLIQLGYNDLTTYLLRKLGTSLFHTRIDPSTFEFGVDEPDWIKVWDSGNLPNPATESWVNNQGFLKSNALNNYYTKNEADGRFALRTRTITGTGSLTGGGDLTANRTIDLSSTTKSDIAKGVTAHSWGNHAGLYVPTSRTITTGNGLTGGGNLTENRTIGLSTTTQNDIAKGVTAHGWGNHAGKYLSLDGGKLQDSSATILELSRNGPYNQVSLKFSTETQEMFFGLGTDGKLRLKDDNNISSGGDTVATESWVNSQSSLQNYYTKTESLNQFVGLSGVQTINNTKTFTSSPVVPLGTLGSHAARLSQITDYGVGTVFSNTPEATDIDDSSLRNGLYKVTSINTGFGSSGTLLVKQSGANGYVTQELQLINAKKLIRHYRPTISQWSEWNELWHTGNLTAGTTAEITTGNTNNRIWSGAALKSKFDNYYTKTEALNQFVGLSGVQDIADTKTFLDSPVVPNPTLDAHAVNRGWVRDSYRNDYANLVGVVYVDENNDVSLNFNKEEVNLNVTISGDEIILPAGNYYLTGFWGPSFGFLNKHLNLSMEVGNTLIVYSNFYETSQISINTDSISSPIFTIDGTNTSIKIKANDLLDNLGQYSTRFSIIKINI